MTGLCPQGKPRVRETCWKGWQDTKEVRWRRMRYPERKVLPYGITLSFSAPCSCHNCGQHLRWWAGGRQSKAALSQRSGVLPLGHTVTCRPVSILMEEWCYRWQSACCYSTLVWRMSNGSNYITGRREPSCTRLWSTLLMAELLYSTRCGGALAALQHCNTSSMCSFCDQPNT